VPLLAACGVNLAEDEFQPRFRDFGAVLRTQAIACMKDMSPTAESIELSLHQAGLIEIDTPPDPSKADFQFAFGFGAGLIEHNPEAGAIYLPVAAAIAAEHGKATQAALDALVKTREVATPAAAWELSELATWPGLGPVGAKAGELAAELRAAGVDPAIYIPRDFSHGSVSGVDGVGSRSLMLFFRTPEGGMDSMIFLLNDEIGIKNAWSIFDDAAGMDEEAQEKTDVISAPIGLPPARELIGDALALHRERGISPPGRMLLYRPYLGSAPLRIERRRPHLGAYALEIVARGPELAAGSERLCNENAWMGFWFAGDAAYEFVRTHLDAIERAPRGAIPSDLLDRFIQEVAIGERDRLLSRMAANLEVEAWAGRAGRPTNRLAARTWLVLSESLQPFHEVPYVLGLAFRAIHIIALNVGMGYRNQQEANEANLT
jgi:hypothetical protein